MYRLEGLLNQYVSADETERLHLYLAHGTLRDRFIRIEMEALAAATEKRPARSESRWLDRCRSGLEAISNLCFHRCR
jgi:hypothetical protein